MQYAKQPVNPEAIVEKRKTDALIKEADENGWWGEGWGDIKDAGLGRIRRSRGIYRIEGCASGAFSVLRHDDREEANGLILKDAIAFTEAVDAQRVKDAAETHKKQRAEIEAAKTKAATPAPSPIKTAKKTKGK